MGQVCFTAISSNRACPTVFIALSSVFQIIVLCACCPCVQWLGLRAKVPSFLRHCTRSAVACWAVGGGGSKRASTGGLVARGAGTGCWSGALRKGWPGPRPSCALPKHVPKAVPGARPLGCLWVWETVLVGPNPPLPHRIPGQTRGQENNPIEIHSSQTDVQLLQGTCGPAARTQKMVFRKGGGAVMHWRGGGEVTPPPLQGCPAYAQPLSR